MNSRSRLIILLITCVLYICHGQLFGSSRPKKPWLTPLAGAGNGNRLNLSTIQNTLSNFSETHNLNQCQTPFGTDGECSDIRKCFYLVLDLTILRQSVCIRNLVLPGVCCPIDGVNGVRPFVSSSILLLLLLFSFPK